MLKRDKNGRFVKGSGGYWKGKKLPYKDKLSKIHKELCSNGINLPPSRKGISPFNKGVPCPEETKEKISKSKIGIPSKRKGVPMYSMRGDKHPNWKGGNNKRYIHLCGSLEYKEWRKKVFERDNYTCQECGVKGGYLQAHHIKGWTEYTELRYDINNGQTLCVDCHKKTDNYAGKSKKRKA